MSGTAKRSVVVTGFVGVVLALCLVVSAQTESGGAESGGAESGGAESGGAAGGAGASESPVPLDDPATVEAGKALFTGKLGCYGCHGQAGGGGMGPSLIDDTWVYGSDAATIHETLVNGRPNGMPKFGEAATDEELWQVVAFVRSLSAAP